MGWGYKIVDLVKQLIREALADIHTQQPAQIVSYDPDKNTCSVQPCLNRLRTNDANSPFVQLPQIDDVPVKMQGSGKTFLSVAPQVGSYGALYISERSLSEWLVNGGIVDPRNTRKFKIDSGWFDPGLYPLAEDGDNGLISPAIKTDRIELRTRTGKTSVAVLHDETISVVSDGDIAVSNSNGNYTLLANGQFDVNGNFTVDP